MARTSRAVRVSGADPNHRRALPGRICAHESDTNALKGILARPRAELSRAGAGLGLGGAAQGAAERCASASALGASACASSTPSSSYVVKGFCFLLRSVSLECDSDSMGHTASLASRENTGSLCGASPTHRGGGTSSDTPLNSVDRKISSGILERSPAPREFGCGLRARGMPRRGTVRHLAPLAQHRVQTLRATHHHLGHHLSQRYIYIWIYVSKVRFLFEKDAGPSLAAGSASTTLAADMCSAMSLVSCARYSFADELEYFVSCRLRETQRIYLSEESRKRHERYAGTALVQVRHAVFPQKQPHPLVPAELHRLRDAARDINPRVPENRKANL